ncbi:MAG: glutaredoxin family protein [Usitatibacteraceae bacterium]
MKIHFDLQNEPAPVMQTRKRKTCTAFVSVLIFAFATAAGAQEIFRWVDKDGKVHYGDSPPPATESKNVQTKKLGDSVIEQDAVPYSVATAIKNNPVTLYANNCGEACTNARALLAKRGVPFADKNPESDIAAANALKALAGGLQVPTLVVGSTSLTGFEESGWNAALDTGGYPRTNPNLRQSAAVKAPPKAAPPAPAK